MKLIPLIAAALAALALTAPGAWAQQAHDSGAHPQARAHAQAHAQASAHAKPAAHRPATAHRHAVNRTRNTTVNARRNVTQNVHRNVTTNVHRNVTRNVHRNVTTNVHRNVTTNRTVNITQYRRVVRAPQRYHYARAWAPPRGYVYRRYGLGERIPSVLLVASYFLSDYGNYGLVAPPPTYVWVRDGSDAVLVNRYTGEVIQVQYDIFY